MSGRGAKKPWTDAEKAQVLFSMIDTSSPINWSKVSIPEGRTQKAVMHMIANEKQRYGISPSKSGNNASDQGDGETPSKKAKTTKTSAGPKKPTAGRPISRKRRHGAVYGGSDDESDNGRPVKTESALGLVKDVPHHDDEKMAHGNGDSEEQEHPEVKQVKQELSDLAYQIATANAGDDEA